jgi:hypothetical protein
VAATADSHQDVILTGETDRGDYVRNIETPCNPAWPTVNHSIVDFTGGLVAFVAGTEKVSP